MAHKKAGASSATQKSNVIGKRLGIKIFGGQKVNPGNIIVRQKGTKFHAGLNTYLGRDFTIMAKTEGTVYFRKLTGPKRGKQTVDVIPPQKKTTAKGTKKTAVKKKVVSKSKSTTRKTAKK